MDLSGKRILISGASSGIGRETAILLSQLKATLTLTGRNETALGETLARLEGEGHRAVPFDLSQVDEIPKWVKQQAAETGPFDGLVHSAGLHAAAPLQVFSVKKFEELMRVNVTAGIQLTKGIRQPGCAAPGCGVVFLSSVMGMVGEAGLTAYSATKSALAGATRSLGVELARQGIRVNSVAAGMVDTEMSQRFFEQVSDENRAAIEAAHPLGLGKPRDVAYGVAYLLGETARWVTGTMLVIDGGYTAR